MSLDVQGIVSTTASGLAIIAGLLALVDRWASRRQPPMPAPLTSPSGLILLTRPRPPLKRSRAVTRVRRVLQVALVVMAWIVSFAAGTNLFTLAISLLAPAVPRMVQAAAATDLAITRFTPIDVLAIIILTNFTSLFLLTSSGWQRRGALIALALGFLLPNGDLWLWLLRR